MDAVSHDRILALTSHLPHVLAFALVDTLAGRPEQSELFRFAAGGFRDFTRIASSDPVMWRDIALANREALLAALDAFSTQAAALRSAIAEGDGPALGAVFSRAKAARDSYVDPAARRRGSAQ
jgi:3-phosphoshikimate 1-carboxyvinyltransferase